MAVRAYIPTEHDEQVSLMRWAQLQSAARPELKLLYAIPNGGQRHKAVAAKLKMEGVKSGVPDIHLPIPRGGHHGLYIELKRRKNGRLSPSQRMWIGALLQAGHKVEVCYGWEQARDVILAYLEAS